MTNAHTLTMDGLNAMNVDTFTTTLADVFEHSPWVAHNTAPARPFANIDELHAAMVLVMQKSAPQAQLNLLCAHPELAGREAQDGELTTASANEQARAGLNALRPDELAHIVHLNKAYLQRHGFPFIVCVGRHTKKSIMETFERRLCQPTQTERSEALNEVSLIAHLRLKAMISV